MFEKFLGAFLSFVARFLWIGIALIFLIIASVSGFCYFTHIDRTVTEGAYEDFKIGSNMAEVFRTASKKMKQDKVVGTFETESPLPTETNKEIFQDYNGIQTDPETGMKFIDTWKTIDSEGETQWREKFLFTPQDFKAMSHFEIWEFYNFDSEDRFTLSFQNNRLVRIEHFRNLCTL